MKRILFAVLLTITITAVIFAQRGAPGARPPFGGPPNAGAGPTGQPRDPLAALKAALNLTDGQVEAIKTVNQTRQERAQAIFAEIEKNRQALNAQLDAATPNPTNVGNAAITLHASEKKLAAERDWYISELKKQLTGDQQQTLDNLLAAHLPVPGLGGPGFGPGPGPRGGKGPRPQ